MAAVILFGGKMTRSGKKKAIFTKMRWIFIRGVAKC